MRVQNFLLSFLLNNGTAILTPAGLSISTTGSTPTTFLSSPFYEFTLHSSGFGNLGSLYGGGVLNALSANSSLGALVSRILGLRLGILNLTASDIKNFIQNFGLFMKPHFQKNKS